MNKELYFIKTVTPLYIGSQDERFEVDKPVVRDVFDVPYIPGSSLKGALRRYFGKDHKSKVENVFGNNENPSKVKFVDAIPLILLAREIERMFLYVVPFIYFEKFLDYVEVVDPNLASALRAEFENLKEESKGETIALVADEDIGNKTIYLNEHNIKTKHIDMNSCENIKKLIEKLEKEFNLPELLNRIVFLFGDETGDIINRSLIVYQRNRLEDDVKRAKPGALWAEEYIPYNSIFVSIIMYDEDIVDQIKVLKNVYTFLGGLETIGKGFCEIKAIDLKVWYYE